MLQEGGDNLLLLRTGENGGMDRGVVALRSPTGEEHFAGKPAAHQSGGLFTAASIFDFSCDPKR